MTCQIQNRNLGSHLEHGRRWLSYLSNVDFNWTDSICDRANVKGKRQGETLVMSELTGRGGGSRSAINLSDLARSDSQYLQSSSSPRRTMSRPMTPTTSSSTTLDFSAAMDWRSQSGGDRGGGPPITYRIGNSKLEFQRRPVMIALFVIGGALFLLCYSTLFGNLKSLEQQAIGERAVGYNATYPLSQPKSTPYGMEYRFAVISDLDENSKVRES